MNSIERLRQLGQSAWLDYLDHDLLESHELDRMIEREGIAGMTSNPTIFQKAIASTSAYDDILRQATRSESNQAPLERILTSEIREACDLDHGKPEERLSQDRRFAHTQIETLAPLAINLSEITDDLEDEGVDKLNESSSKTTRAIADKRRRLAA